MKAISMRKSGSTLRSITITLAMMLGLSGIAFAMPPKHEPDFNRLAAELEITEEQLDQFLIIMREQHQERKAMHEQARDNMMDNMKERMDILDQSLLTKLEAVLTTEQLEEFSARMEKRKQERKMRRMLSNNSDDCCRRHSR